jgi:hypothetical protein
MRFPYFSLGSFEMQIIRSQFIKIAPQSDHAHHLEKEYFALTVVIISQFK